MNPPKAIQQGQIADLHTARGIAALIVLFHHISLVNTLGTDTRHAIDTVLNAHGAVMFFFVLSGYVLTQSLARTGTGSAALAQYVTRRAFRIYPALLAAFVLASVVWFLGNEGSGAGKSDWYIRYVARFFALDMDAHTVAQNLLPVSFVANPPTWSIAVELLGALLIPLLFIFFSKGRVHVIAGLAFLLVMSGIFAGKAGGFHYANFKIVFALGSAIHFVPLPTTVARKRLVWIAVLSCAGLLLCRAIYKVVVIGEMSAIDVENAHWGMSLLEGGFSVLLVACLAAPNWRDGAVRLPRVLGDFSYSIYLLHFPLILLAVGAAPFVGAGAEGPLLWIGVPVATFALSALSFHWIEKPGIALGRRLSRRIGPRRAALQTA